MNVPMLTLVASYALAFVGKVRTLVRMQIGTFDALLTISKTTKCITDLGRGIDTNMREATVVIRASSLLKMKTGRDIVWGGFV